MIKALVFDNFGVLYDRSAVYALEELAQGDLSLEEPYWALFRSSDRGLITRDEWERSVAELFGISVDAWRSTLASYDNKNKVLLDMLPAFREKYRVALLTNMAAGRVRDYYSDEQLQRSFDEVVGSGDIGIAKPDVEIYEYTARKLSVETGETVFIDDSELNIAGAAKAGMKTILFINNAQFLNELEVLLSAEMRDN